MKVNLLVNPFERLAGWPALILGLALMAFTAVAGWAADLYFDGVIDMHYKLHSLPDAFIAQAADWAVMLLCLWVAASIFSKTKFRLLDLAAAAALSRVPLLIAAGIFATPFVRTSDMGIEIFGMAAFVLCVWMAVVLYNGYSVSCNISGGKAIVSLIGTLLVAEVLSKLLFAFVLTGFFPVKSAQADLFAIPQEQTIQQTASIAMKSFERGDYNTLSRYLTPQMKQGFDQVKMRMMWSQFNMSMGEFMGADTEVQPTVENGCRTLDVTCRFSRGEVTLQFTFDSGGYIARLFII